MVKEAESHSHEDKSRRDVIDARNQADALAYSAEKTVNESRDRLPATVVSEVESAIAALREVAQKDDLQAIQRASEALQKVTHAMAEQLYKQQASGPGPEANKNDDVKEGEVVEA
jgi:molecular chaperone DnaK